LKPDVKTVVTSLTPKFEGEYARRFDQLCKALNRRDPTGRDETLRAARISSEVAWASEMTMNRVESQRYLTAVLILSDLINLRWELDYSPTGLELVAPPFPDARGLTTEGIQKLKSDLRNELAPAVRKQLEHPATVDFIRRMEQPHQQAKHQSIRLLIADGTELVNRLQNVVALTEAEQENALSVAVRPYLQLVNSEQRDQFTGIRLGDVWRYFRHTWSIPSMSIPGRQLLYLVRDAAHPNHSVMGIAALSNAAMQLGVRDVYIGWTTANFRGHFLDVIQRQDLSTCSYLIDILERYIETGIEEIDWQGLVEPHEVIEPSETVVNRLRTQVSIFAKERQSELKRSNSDINGDLGEIEEEIFELADVEDEALQPDVSKEILALDEKGYEAKIGDASDAIVGPAIVRFPFELARGIRKEKLDRSLQDIGREMALSSLIVHAERNSRNLLLDVPRQKRLTLEFNADARDTLPTIQTIDELPLALGVTPSGISYIADLKTLVHMLVGGTTGSGKTIFLYSVILSLLQTHPLAADLQLVLCTSKLEDFAFFRGLPQLFGNDIITDVADAISIIGDIANNELDNRSRILAQRRVRSVEDYNRQVSHEEQIRPIVIIVDEFADLADQVARDRNARDALYTNVRRIAQAGRSRSVHLVLCTQRPTSELFPSNIKALMNARIAFRMNSQVDSRTILDESGAEHLLGKGDMLFKANGETERLQGFFVNME